MVTNTVKSTERRKPVGESGVLTIGPERQSAEYKGIHYGGTKIGIENYFLEVTLASARKKGVNLYNLTEKPVQNLEDDFDFTLNTQFGKQYLDLMEVAPLEEIDGSYLQAPASYNNGEMADRVWAKLEGKSRKYGTHRPERIHLLLYSTDWRFRLADGVLGLLRFRAKSEDLVFASIVYYSPADQESGTVTILHPVAETSSESFDDEHVRAKCSERLDLSRFKIEPDGSVVLSGAPGHKTEKKAG